jgi:hypothetical protein
MRNGFLGSLAAFLTGAGLLLAQPPAPKPDSPAAPAEPAAAPTPAANGPSLAPLGDLMQGVKSIFGCGPGCAGPGDGGYNTRFWVSGEYLIWWNKDARPFPILLLAGDLPSPTGEGGGVSPGFGNSVVDYREFYGGRFNAGYWFDEARHYAVEGSMFFLTPRSLRSRNDAFPVLFRPFFDLNNRMDSVQVVAFPGLAAGSFTASTSSRMWGGEVNVWKNLVNDYSRTCMRVDLLLGLRYLELGEDLTMVRETTFNANPVGFPQFLALRGNRFLESDTFLARNQFYGPQIGIAAKYPLEVLILDLRAKIAAGTNHQEINIFGNQLRTRPDGTTTFAPAGLYALPSNSGRHRREQVAYVPELNVNVGFPINRHMGFYVGYTYIYWSKVVRPGDQIDTVLDVTQIPNSPIPASPSGQARPAVPFTQSHYWVQGVNFSLEFSW